MKIVTHPDNVEAIRREVREVTRGGFVLSGIEVIADRYIPKTKFTGRYILRNGQKLKRADLVVPDGRFFEWGNSDAEVKFMIDTGMIREEHEMLAYQFNDSLFAKFLDRAMLPPRPIAFSSF